MCIHIAAISKLGFKLVLDRINGIGVIPPIATKAYLVEVTRRYMRSDGSKHRFYPGLIMDFEARTIFLSY